MINNSTGLTSGVLNHSNNRRNKKFQACVSCRASKIKCLPSDRPEVCQSCLKASRTCILPGPAKPRIKSAQKFSELEKKIALLTDALAVKDDSSQHGLEGANQPGSKDNPRKFAISSNETSPENYSHHEPTSVINLNSRLPFTPSHSAVQDRLDVVGDGSLDLNIATSLFNHWRKNMHPLVPLLCFEPVTNLEQIRQERPLLFLAIITVASVSACPSVSTMLVHRLTEELGRRIFVQNAPSAEIILATILFSQYYFHPKGTATLVPSQYVYAVAAMSTDLGFHTHAKALWANQSEQAVRAARMSLSEWYIASVTATLVHRNPIVQYSPDLEKLLKTVSKEPTTSEAWFLSLLKLQTITESALLLLDSVNTKAVTTYDEPSTQYKINMLLEKLEVWESEVPETVDIGLKQHGVHTTYLYIHKIAVQCFVHKIALEKQNGQHGSSYPNSGIAGLSPAHFDCLSKCIISIKTTFDIYLAFEDSMARCLPNNYLFWNLNAAVIMLKLSYLGESLTKQQSTQPPFVETVVHYLDAMVAKLERVSQDGYLPQAEPYIKILRKLKPYYLQKRDICVNSQGDVLVEQHGVGDKGVVVTIESGPRYVEPISEDIPIEMRSYASSRTQAQQANGSESSSGWTTTSESRHTPLTVPSLSNQAPSPALDIDAAYDPYTYANTDWSNLALDPDTLQQLDSFVMDDSDTAWMNSLL